jgi:RecB family exonuclease
MARSSQYVLVKETYERGDTLLVFPSEVTAAAWRRALTTEGTTTAIRTDRLVSWDVFKEMAIPIKDRRRPVSRLIRTAFAEILIRDNGKEPFLSTLINPAYAGDDPDISDALAQMFPRLLSLLDAASFLSPGIVGDLTEIEMRYRSLLDTYELFEPNWELRGRVEVDHLIGKPVIFWPELLEDFDEYKSGLVAVAEFEPLPDSTEYTTARYREFGTSRDELTALWNAIEGDLVAGIPPYEIAVTVANLQTLKPWITEQAQRRGVPVRYAAGEAIAAQSGGTFFSRIDEVFRAGWSVTAVASLLYDRSVPWQDATLNDRLVRFGYKTHCYSLREWRHAFEIAGTLPVSEQPKGLSAIRRRFDVLYTDVSALASAKTPRALWKAFRRFLSNHIAPPGAPEWDRSEYAATQRVYETAQRELLTIIDIEDRGIAIASPWRFFLSAIAAKQYVPKQSSGAIAIYPYRVAAGVPTERHYVIGLSQADTRVRPVPPIGIRMEDLRSIGVGGVDRSEAFIRAYARCMGNTVTSSAKETPTGVHVSPSELMGLPTDDTAVDPPLWEVERSWWGSSTASPPKRIYAPQRDGLQRAIVTTLSPVGIDFQTQTVPRELLAEMKPIESWSPTSIDRYKTCPFAFFVRNLLGIREGEWGFNPINRQQLGSIIHEVIARVAREQIVIAPDRDARIRTVVAEAFNAPTVQLYLPRIAIDQWRRYVVAVIERLSQEEAIGLETVGPVEWAIGHTVEGVAIRGKIDRVVDDTDTVAIIDYKLRVGNRYTVPKVLPDHPDPLGAAKTVQLPCYVYLYRHQPETHDGEVDRVAYVDLTEGTIKTIADRNGAKGPREAWDRLERASRDVPRFVREIDERVRSGDLRCQDEPDCTACGIRGICRSCFVTRRFTDAV